MSTVGFKIPEPNSFFSEEEADLYIWISIGTKIPTSELSQSVV